MLDKKGWLATDFDFEDIYDLGYNVEFVYEDTIYYIQTDKHPKNVYLYEGGNCGKLIKIWNNKEEFYNAIIFGRPIIEVINDSYIRALE